MKILRHLRGKVDAVDSVRENLIELALKEKFIPQDLLVCYNYNMHRLILSVYKRFVYKGLVSKNLEEKYPLYDWDNFSNTIYYKNLKKEYENKINEEKNLLRQAYIDCEPYLEKIAEYNSSF